MNKSLNLAGYIDHAVLKSEASEEDIRQACQESIKYNFAALFVNSSYVSFCSQLLSESDVKVGSVAGFPLGATATEVKSTEAAYGVDNGADEIDIVADIGAIKSGNWEILEKEIVVIRSILSARITLKVILECTLLTKEEKIRAAQITADCGADFVKTSTGFFGQATVKDVKLLNQTVGDRIKVKASGGIRTLEQALARIDAGASRLGTSAGAYIIEEQRKEG